MSKKQKKYRDKSCLSAEVDRQAVARTRWLLSVLSVLEEKKVGRTGDLLKDMAEPVRKLSDNLYARARDLLDKMKRTPKETKGGLDRKDRCEWVLNALSILDDLKNHEDRECGHTAGTILCEVNVAVLDLGGEFYEHAKYYIHLPRPESVETAQAS